MLLKFINDTSISDKPLSDKILYIILSKYDDHTFLQFETNNSLTS